VTPYDVLVKLPYFSGLPEDQLEALCRVSETIPVQQGEEVISEGKMPSGLLVVAEGSFEATRQSGRDQIVLGTASVGDVLGEMSLIENRPASASVQALEPGLLVRVPADEFRHALADPVLIASMFHTVTGRLRQREAALVQSEKLASLGSWTAGLLHEVNNPAAAALRSASDLAEITELLVPPASSEQLRPLARSQRESAIAAILRDHGVERPAELASSLVAQGWTPERLLGEGDGIARTAQLVHARQLAIEVSQAARRISELVAAVKRWSYHGQGDVQPVDLNQIVEDGVVLLRHRVGSIALDLQLDPELGEVEGHGVELSQVVTNLLDNALQAAASKVTVVTKREGDQISLEVTDDGAGIPDEIQARIWDPFFTTKPPGQGSGLGLSIVKRIVSEHHGSIGVKSVPGATTFRLGLRNLAASS
jgi:signal transduction histidine kinase